MTNTDTAALKWTLKQIADLDPKTASVGTAIFMAKESLASPAVEAPELTDDAFECLQDVVSHHSDFRGACEKRAETCIGDDDKDSAAYWWHQIATLDRMNVQAERALLRHQPAGADPWSKSSCNYIGQCGCKFPCDVQPKNYLVLNEQGFEVQIRPRADGKFEMLGATIKMPGEAAQSDAAAMLTAYKTLIHTHHQESDGSEFGFCRVKHDANGQLISCLWAGHDEIEAAAGALLRQRPSTEAPVSAPARLPPDELTWLYTHCRAIGMTCKSDSGKWEHDIALFTTLLQQRITELEAVQPTQKPDECPNCRGSGEATCMSDNGPHAYEMPISCPHCGGTGALADAYRGVCALLAEANKKYLKACGELYFADRSAQQVVAVSPEVQQADLAGMVSKALHRAWQLGQTYCHQGDSESYSQNKKAGETARKFYRLIDDTCAAIQSTAGGQDK